MTRLLVSVRSVAEAEAALDGGAALVDVKEPDRGPLGAADSTVIESIVRAVGKRALTSAALGELDEGHRLPTSLAGRLDFAKFGLAGCGNKNQWHASYAQAVAALPAGVAAVAVAYADWQRAEAPQPWTVLSRAVELGCRAILIDTFDKSRGSTATYAAEIHLQRYVDEARRAGLLTVVAGGLQRDDLLRLAPLAPDYFGVRGAACLGGRRGRIEKDRVRALVAALESHSHQPPPVSSLTLHE
jgi:uncharacterized protein (UPF0264 family)